MDAPEDDRCHGRTHQEGGQGQGEEVREEEVGREGMEPEPGEGTGEHLAGDGQGGGLPDFPDRVDAGALRVPAIQDGEEQENARHREVGELKARR